MKHGEVLIGGTLLKYRVDTPDFSNYRRTEEAKIIVWCGNKLIDKHNWCFYVQLSKTGTLVCSSNFLFYDGIWFRHEEDAIMFKLTFTRYEAPSLQES